MMAMNLLIVIENKPTFKLGYRKHLDGVRGIAVLLVLIFHSNTGWLRGGFIGVDIFFVLSGFLITSLLLQEWQASADISLRKFYLRRVLRLLPALACFLLICSVVIWGRKTGNLQPYPSGGRRFFILLYELGAGFRLGRSCGCHCLQSHLVIVKRRAVLSTLPCPFNGVAQKQAVTPMGRAIVFGLVKYTDCSSLTAVAGRGDLQATLFRL